MGAAPPDLRIWDLLPPQLQAPQHPQLLGPSAAYGPNSGYIVLGLCEKIIHNQTVHTSIDVMNMYGDNLPLDLKVLALVDVSEGLSFLHANGIVYGDLKPLIYWYQEMMKNLFLKLQIMQH